MQCHEFSIMADLNDKYYTVFEYIRKRYFIGQNTIADKNKLQPYRVFLYAK